MVRYSAVTWMSLSLKSPTDKLFVQHLVRAYNLENSKAKHHWPFLKGIDWWIPFTKDQQCVNRSSVIIDSSGSSMMSSPSNFSSQSSGVFSGFSIIKIRRSWDRLIFIMWIPQYTGKTTSYIETPLCLHIPCLGIDRMLIIELTLEVQRFLKMSLVILNDLTKPTEYTDLLLSKETSKWCSIIFCISCGTVSCLCDVL